MLSVICVICNNGKLCIDKLIVNGVVKVGLISSLSKVAVHHNVDDETIVSS